MAAKYVEDILKTLGEPDKVPVLNEWVKFIEQTAQVILLKVPDDLNAFVMFETLNDRTMPNLKRNLQTLEYQRVIWLGII